MTARHETIAGGWRVTEERRLRLLRLILGFGILSTGLHFTHNFVAIDQYPDDLVSGSVVRVAILLFWPLFTGLALYAYRLYAQGRRREAHPLLCAYAFFALTTLGHFLDGTPDIAPFWFATIFTDALAGIAVLAFTLWSMKTP
jgi:peptidoglycan/LPS O-acetylase OafA/YrhL